MRKKILYILLAVFFFFIILLNFIAYNHSYKFTHFTDSYQTKLKVYDTSNISVMKKIKYILTGIDVPRPRNGSKPSRNYKTENIPTNKGNLELWRKHNEEGLGTIILFHGYANKKSSLISRAEEFYNLGYTIVLVDFLGSGGSDGNTTSIGYHEADQVKACYDHVKAKGEKNIYLFGISMGAVAIMKCVKDHHPDVKGIMLECPFGYFKTTVKNRFKNFGIPPFPMADLLMLWGSYHGDYWTYDHNPADYAKEIDCPTLLMHGQVDHAVSSKEIDAIYTNLKGEKKLVVFEKTGHDIFTSGNRTKWTDAIIGFLISTGSLNIKTMFQPI